MSYHGGVGAGPGPSKTYKVDAPFPWGKDTEVTVPVQAMVDDTWAALAPHIDELEARLINDMEDEVSLYAPRVVKQLMDEVVRPEIAKQMEVAFAEVGMVKDDVVKKTVGVAVGLAVAIGLAAWYIKKG
jgi:hypothetical protein